MHLKAVCEKLFTKDMLREFMASDAEWFEKATDGAPSSHRPPSAAVTPSAKPFGYHEVHTTPTPLRVVQPFKKAELQASKRLQAAMANPGDAETLTYAKKVKTDKMPPQHVGDEPRQVEPDQVPAEADGCDGGPVPCTAGPSKAKKARKAANGPMQEHYAAFLVKKKGEGMSHLEAMRSWAASEERRAVLSTLPEAECRRRRYQP